ncbi:hypothetical protein [Ferrimonas marina]|uniref:Uncharacterized protein n=1 Tax=Ferrimonas marina TaxID=299255 RepID=A0A1M5X5B3_9GAMM|nr:hypothetical protein [Ferrimonas marina]SHH95019.1 hypothetical protein SAMN02745129_3241 [Ferrimonas marina]
MQPTTERRQQQRRQSQDRRGTLRWESVYNQRRHGMGRRVEDQFGLAGT